MSSHNGTNSFGAAQKNWILSQNMHSLVPKGIMLDHLGSNVADIWFADQLIEPIYLIWQKLASTFWQKFPRFILFCWTDTFYGIYISPHTERWIYLSRCRSPSPSCSKPDNVGAQKQLWQKKTALNKSVLEHTAAAFKYLDIYLVRIYRRSHILHIWCPQWGFLHYTVHIVW